MTTKKTTPTESTEVIAVANTVNISSTTDQERAEQKTLLEKLSEPFPPEVERTLSKGGARLTYIPVSEVINRLNRVLGLRKWSSEIVKCERDALDPDFIVAHVRLTILGEGSTIITKDGFGGQKIKRTKAGDIVDLGDEFKGAVSDALKKAAQQVGVALYLARSEEALEYDVEEAPVDPAVKELNDMYANFMNLRAGLKEDGITQLRSFWSEYSGGRPVPKAGNFTKEELSKLIDEVTRISLDGTWVAEGE